MVKFAAIFVCLASMAYAAPADKPEAASTVDPKKNQTEPTQEPKSIPTTGSYMSYPSGYKNLPWNPSTASFYSAPSGYSSYKPYYPVARNPNFRLYRPSVYQPQAMPYSMSAQALQTVPIHASPVYRPYAPYYSGFSHYRQANPMNQPESLIPAPTKVIIHEEPFDKSLPVMPILRDQQMPVFSRSLPVVPVSPDQQMPNGLSRDASVWSPEFQGQPQAYFSPMEDNTRGIFIDDKQNMQIQPTYLVNRLHMDSQDARAAEEESNLSGYMPIGTDSRVYMVMNQYDQQPQVARAAYEEGTSYSIFGQEPSNSWMQPQMPIHDGKTMPYTSQSIAKLMEEMYMAKYHQDLQNTKGRSAEVAKPSQPEKAEEKKETPDKA